MPTAEMTNMVRAYLDGVNNKNPNQVATVLADNLEWISPLGKFVGKDQAKKYIGKWLTAFPDLKLEQVRVLSEGDQLALEYTATGTHQGTFATPLGHFSATGKKISFDIAGLFKIQNGMFTHVHVFYDVGTILSQLGIQALKSAA